MTTKKNVDVTIGTVTFKADSPFASLIPQIVSIVDQIKAADATLAGLAGTHAARKAEALAKLEANDDPTVLAYREALEALEVAKSNHDDARQALDEAVSEALRADKSASTVERDAVLAAREVLVTSAGAMATLIAGATKPVTASDLGLSKPKGSGSSGGTRTVKAGQGVFSYRRNGAAEFTVPNDHQQSLSSIAFRVFNRAPVGDLRNAMTAANGDVSVDETKPYEVTVTLRDVTATIRFEVVTPEATEG